MNVVSEGERNPRKWRTLYKGDAETHCHASYWAEGAWLWYGSGRTEVVLSELPIVLRMRWQWTGRRILLNMSVQARREASMAIQRIARPAAGQAASGPGLADQSDWPHLIEYLTSVVYADGTARQPSTLIVVADGNGWRGCVADKDNDRTLWKAAGSVLDLLTLLEQALAEDDPAAWRQAAGAKWKGKKRS